MVGHLRSPARWLRRKVRLHRLVLGHRVREALQIGDAPLELSVLRRQACVAGGRLRRLQQLLGEREREGVSV